MVAALCFVDAELALHAHDLARLVGLAVWPQTIGAAGAGDQAFEVVTNEVLVEEQGGGGNLARIVQTVVDSHDQSSWGRRRVALTSPRRFFSVSRRSFEPRVGRVAPHLRLVTGDGEDLLELVHAVLPVALLVARLLRADLQPAVADHVAWIQAAAIVP